MLKESLREEVILLARKLYPNNKGKRTEVIARLIDISTKIEGRDVLIIHSPGGWGSSDIRHLIDWERSVVDGVGAALTEIGVKWSLVQYFRGRDTQMDHLMHLPEQVWYGLTGRFFAAKVMAEELQFLIEHHGNLKIVMLGASMGAAFNNTVMKSLKKDHNIYSIELGIVFIHFPRRLINDRILNIDNNGFIPDPVVHWDFIKTARAYFTAPYRWVKYRLNGTPQKFAYCINVPGHEYRWEFPGVGERIREFLNKNLQLEAGNLVSQASYKR